MDIMTVLGPILAAVFLIIGILLGGSLLLFYNPPSIMITFGGAFTSYLTCYPKKEVLNLINILKNAFFEKQESPQEIIGLLVKFAERARREGILALEKQLEEITDSFLKNGIQLAVDGTEPELLKEIMETELAYLDERHKSGFGQLETLGYYGPSFGLIGTIIGLICMLANLNDPKALGPNMAVSLITTFYGALLANVVCLPLATKLKNKNAEELLIKNLMIEGILSIQSGDNPRIVEQKLYSFIAPKERIIREE